MEYIACYFDHQKNSILHFPSLNDLTLCKYNINSIIVKILWTDYYTSISDEYLFISNPVNTNVSGVFKKVLCPEKTLIFNKSGLVVDVSIEEKINKIFSVEYKITSLYKFCILSVSSNKEFNKNYNLIPVCDPSCHTRNIFIKQEYREDCEYPDSDASSIFSEIEDQYKDTNKRPKIPLPPPPLVPEVLDHKTLFLNELKERVKKFKK